MININNIKGALYLSIIYHMLHVDVLGPILFVLYTLQLGKIMKQGQLSYHFDADDSQIYDVHVTATNQIEGTIDKGENGNSNVRQWMNINYLILNGDKTEVVFAGSRKNIDKIKESSINIENNEINLSSKQKAYLDVLDSEFSMD